MAADLNKAIKSMHSANKYKQMVFYIEACQSGSIFATLLPKDINGFATTAANSHESSYACYFDKDRNTYLGDVYSVKWMEDSDMEDLRSETLQKQFLIVTKETNTSHVMRFGDILDAVPSEQVPLAILSHKLAQDEFKEEELKIMAEVKNLLQLRASIEATMAHIVAVSTKNGELAPRLMNIRHQLVDFDCYESVLAVFDEKCFDLSTNEYALRKLYNLLNLCEEGLTTDAINLIC